MTTPTPTPLMTLEETKDIIGRKAAHLRMVGKFQGWLHSDSEKELAAYNAVLHHLEAGKLVCQCKDMKIARGSILPIRNGIPSIGGCCYIQHCPWCGGTLSPQPQQEVQG